MLGGLFGESFAIGDISKMQEYTVSRRDPLVPPSGVWGSLGSRK